MPSNDYKETVRRDINDKRKPKKKALPFGCSSRFAVCAAFCIICCVAVLVVAKWDVLSPKGIYEWFAFSSTDDGSFLSSLSGTSVLENNLQTTENGLIYVSDTSIVSLEYNGKKLFSSQHNFTNPLIKTSSAYSIAYNVGGSNYRIISNNEELYRSTQGTSIVDCDITNSGIYCVISDKTGYLSLLSVYDDENNLIFSYSFNDYYALSVSLNESGTMAAVGASNTVDGKLVSKVYLLDFLKDKPVNVYTYDDQIVYNVEFLSKNTFAVVTDSLTSVVNCDKNKEIPYSYGTRVLTAYNISYDNCVVLSLSRSDDGRECTVVTLDAEGNEFNSFATSDKIFALDVNEDKIAYLSGNYLNLCNPYGDSLGKWEVGTDAKSVVLPQNKVAYILGVSEIRRVDMK